MNERPEVTQAPAGAIEIIPLGGATEIGKNLTVYRLDGRLLIADCGLMFPDESHPGVDLLIPDFTFLRENREAIEGIVITHGHEDHIGALAFVLRELPVPLWATRLTLGLIRKRLHEHGLWADTQWQLVEAGDRVQIGPFNVEWVRVNHSVPDACSLVIRTRVGIIVHTGDFKFDHTPVDGEPTDFGALSAAGEEGVLALVTDSTNADKPGHVPSEQVVYRTLERVFRQATGRVLVALFASNISRIQQVMRISEAFGRRVALAGRSMIANVDVSRELGYLQVADDTLIRLEEVSHYAASEVTIISTGSQGEPLSALSRISTGDHRQVQVQEGDTVVLSSTPVPGNEAVVWRVVNNLCRRGAKVVYSAIEPGIHVSGHGYQEELKLMASLVRPRFLIPVHGEPRHQELWREMATAMGLDVVKLENGDVLRLTWEAARCTEKVPSGVVIVDGTGVSDAADVVLRDRWHLAQDGIFIVVCTLDAGTGRVISGPDCVSRGAILTTEEELIYDEARSAVQGFLDGLPQNPGRDVAVIAQEIRQTVNRVLRKKTGRRPMVVPVVSEI